MIQVCVCLRVVCEGMHAYIHKLHTLHTHTLHYARTCIHTHIYITYMHECIYYIHIYTYIHTYIHTCIHTYIHMHTHNACQYMVNIDTNVQVP